MGGGSGQARVVRVEGHRVVLAGEFWSGHVEHWGMSERERTDVDSQALGTLSL